MTAFVRRHPIFVFVALCLVPVHGVLGVALALGAVSESLQPLKLVFAVLPSATALVLTWIIGGGKGLDKLMAKTFSPTFVPVFGQAQSYRLSELDSWRF